MAQVNPMYIETADALIERLEECGVQITDPSRWLMRVTVIGWLDELALTHEPRKRVSRTQAAASVPALVTETRGDVLKSTRQGFLRWIVQWTFTIGFKLLGLFTLWTLPLYFDEEPTIGVKK